MFELYQSAVKSETGHPLSSHIAWTWKKNTLDKTAVEHISSINRQMFPSQQLVLFETDECRYSTQVLDDFLWSRVQCTGWCLFLNINVYLLCAWTIQTHAFTGWIHLRFKVWYIMYVIRVPPSQAGREWAKFWGLLEHGARMPRIRSKHLNTCASSRAKLG